MIVRIRSRAPVCRLAACGPQVQVRDATLRFPMHRGARRGTALPDTCSGRPLQSAACRRAAGRQRGPAARTRVGAVPEQGGPGAGSPGEDKFEGAPADDPEQRFRRFGARSGASFSLDVGNWWAGALSARRSTTSP